MPLFSICNNIPLIMACILTLHRAGLIAINYLNVRTTLKIIAALLLISWFVSVFVFAFGKLLHLLLIFAVIAWVLGRRKRKKERRLSTINRGPGEQGPPPGQL